MYLWKKIRLLKVDGKSIKAIAKTLKISRNTVRKYLRQETPPEYSKTHEAISQWSQYKKEILKQSQNLLPAVIYENLIEQGATGSKSGFYNFYNSFITKKKELALSMRFETLPGVQAQFDWSEYIINYKKTGKSKVYILSLILGNSRYRLNVASKDVKQISLFQGIELGLQYFGGVPKEILIDNPRQFVDNSYFKTFKINKHFEELAAYYNIRIHACKVRRPQTKGKIENPYSYLENHFIKNNEFEDFLDLSQKLSKFTEKVNNQYHFGLGDIPKKVWEKIERPLLRPLPKKSYFEVFHKEIRQVNHTGTIQFRGVSYSVPVLYSHKNVRAEPMLGYKLNIYALNGRQIAEHLISQKKGGIVTKIEHYEPFLKKSSEKYTKVKKEFLSKFPEEIQFVKKLQETKKSHYLNDLSKILHLSDYYKKSDVQLSFRSCEQYENYRYDMVYSYLKNNCEQKLEETFIKEALSLDKIYISTDTRDLKYYNI